MRMRALPCVLALLLGVGAALLVSCGGSSGQIPANDAAQLKGHLDEIGAAVAQRHCQAADAALSRARSDLTNLDDMGTKIDGRLRSRLRDGVDKLERRATVECKPATETTTQTIETTSTAVPTQTVPTVSVPTETTTATTPTQPPPDTTTTPVPPTTTITPGGTGGIPSDPGGGVPPGAGGKKGNTP